MNENALRAVIRAHLERYPAMEPIDLAKLLFQRELGCGHLLTDKEKVLAYLAAERDATLFDPTAPLFTDVGNGLTRLSLAACPRALLDDETLCELFCRSAATVPGDRETLREALLFVKNHFGDFPFAFSEDDYAAFLESYFAAGLPMVSHSESYRAASRPAYRILDRALLLEALPGGLLRCPLCRAPLIREDKRYFCPAGHSYDRSKEGQVHLLPGKGSAHGDDKEMIRARHRFLESGAYAPLRDALASLLREQNPATLLDAGCGEGFYTAAAAEIAARTVGIDLSGEALRLAAKRRLPRSEWAVASVYDLPLPDGSFDAILSVFSPFAGDEFKRLLAPDGIVYDVIPAERHLWELKSLLYENPYENAPEEGAPDGFTLLSSTPVEFGMALSHDLLADLFTMTPYYYRTPAAGRARLEQTESLTVTASFRILRLQKA